VSEEHEAAPAPHWKRTLLLVGLCVAAAALVALAPTSLREPTARGTRPAFGAAIAVLMAGLWLTEAVPVAWTALLPLVLAPALGIYGADPLQASLRAAAPFADGYLILFLGGMVLGAGMEESGLHRRIALRIMAAIGRTTPRLLLGLVVATASVSLWISNTATAVMMTPIAASVVSELEDSAGRKLPGVATAFLLAVAYGSNVGGIGTKIGTGTNSIYCGVVAETLGVDIGFVRFLVMCFPFVVIFVPLVWLALHRVARRDGVEGGRGTDVVRGELAKLGGLGSGERKVVALFGAAAFFWIFGELFRPPLAAIAKARWDVALPSKRWEAGVAAVMALLLLAVRGVGRKGLARLPLSSLALLGGSFAMAQAIETSGLSEWLGARFAGVASLGLGWQLLAVSSGTIALTAIASNTATINVALGVLPKSLTLYTAAMIGASCDFMLPAGTPPNAIVFATGRVRLPAMIRTGAALDVAAAIVITAYMLVWGRFVLP